MMGRSASDAGADWTGYYAWSSGRQPRPMLLPEVSSSRGRSGLPRPGLAMAASRSTASGGQCAQAASGHQPLQLIAVFERHSQQQSRRPRTHRKPLPHQSLRVDLVGRRGREVAQIADPFHRSHPMVSTFPLRSSTSSAMILPERQLRHNPHTIRVRTYAQSPAYEGSPWLGLSHGAAAKRTEKSQNRCLIALVNRPDYDNVLVCILCRYPAVRATASETWLGFCMRKQERNARLYLPS